MVEAAQAQGWISPGHLDVVFVLDPVGVLDQAAADPAVTGQHRQPAVLAVERNQWRQPGEVARKTVDRVEAGRLVQQERLAKDPCMSVSPKRFLGDRTTEFAWQAILGSEVAINDNLSLNLAYHYADLGKLTTAANSAGGVATPPVQADPADYPRLRDDPRQRVGVTCRSRHRRPDAGNTGGMQMKPVLSIDRGTGRRAKLVAAAFATVAVLAAPALLFAAEPDLAAIRAKVAEQHDASLKRLQDWIALPSIAAENRNSREGAEYMARLAREAGFQTVEILDTDGKPGVFATLDAGAAKTVGLYFMYDVKQFDPAEWSSPPLEARLVDKPGLGKVLVGRGAVNQKGPESALLAALDAIRGAGQTMPVNLVLVAEGEEEIGSPHIGQLVRRADVAAALGRTVGVFMPAASQDLDGVVTVSLGAKGVVELELVASGERWGRGPGKDIHSSLKAMVDSPAWRLVKALDTLVSDDGNTITVDNYPVPPPISAEDKAMVAAAIAKRSEAKAKQQLGVTHWIDDLSWRAANERLVSQPTINIEGLVGGYTGPGGKTVLPHRAVAKIDMRLVPGMRKDDAVAALRSHLAKRGYGDIEVNVSGGYDSTRTRADAPLIQAQLAVLRERGLDPLLWPRNAGSYPGFVFTDPPLGLASGHFGLGHGSGAHAPDEYYLIESSNPAIEGYDGAVMSFVEYLYALGQ